MSDARFSLDQGDRFPYDGGAAFWNGEAPVPSAKDWAHRAARGILADLSDRRGIKHELEAVEHDVRADLAESLAEIIRTAYEASR